MELDLLSPKLMLNVWQILHPARCFWSAQISLRGQTASTVQTQDISTCKAHLENAKVGRKLSHGNWDWFIMLPFPSLECASHSETEMLVKSHLYCGSHIYFSLCCILKCFHGKLMTFWYFLLSQRSGDNQLHESCHLPWTHRFSRRSHKRP